MLFPPFLRPRPFAQVEIEQWKEMEKEREVETKEKAIKEKSVRRAQCLCDRKTGTVMTALRKHIYRIYEPCKF